MEFLVNQRTKHWVAIALLCGALLALVYLLYAKNVHTPAVTQVPPTEKGAALSLRGLLDSHAVQQCTFTQQRENGSRTGTVYMAEGRMRGDFSVEGGAKSAHMITDGYEARFWSDSEATGVVLKYREESASSRETDITLDLDAAAEYTCSEWAADSTLLQPPADIVFKKVEELFPESIPEDEVGTSTATSSPLDISLGDNITPSTTRSGQCRLCDKVVSPDSQKECFLAFGCG